MDMDMDNPDPEPTSPFIDSAIRCAFVMDAIISGLRLVASSSQLVSLFFAMHSLATNTLQSKGLENPQVQYRDLLCINPDCCSQMTATCEMSGPEALSFHFVAAVPHSHEYHE